MNFLKKLFNRPVTVCTVSLLVLGFGLLAAFNMPVNLLPDIAFPALGVTVVYPGASAETCDTDVRPVLEASLKTLPNVQSATSYCTENATTVTLQFNYGTDVDKKINEIKDKLALTSLPESCYDPVYTKIDFNANAVATVAVYNDGNEDLLYSDAQAIKERLAAIENVGSVSASGVPQEQIVIRPFNGLETTALLIVQKLSENAQLDIPLGSITQNGDKIAFRNDSMAETTQEINDTCLEMPVSKELGQILSIASTAMDFIQNTPSAKLTEYSDKIKQTADEIASINLKTGQEILDYLENKVNVDQLIQLLKLAGFNDLADSLSAVYDYVKQNPGVLNVPGEIINAFQEAFSAIFNQQFFNLCNKVIQFKKEREYLNPITGEIVQEEISDKDFASLINDANLPIPVTFTAEYVRLARSHDFSNLSYGTDGNAKVAVKISEVATVKKETTYSSYSYYNGRPAAILKVYGISGANTTDISSNVKKALQSDVGIQSKAVLIDDQSQFVSDSISNVLSSLAIGGALAVIVILLFLKKLNTSLIVAVTMPLSVLGAIGCMYFMGITLNMVSLGGLAVGIGMLVDNSIVIIESINAERDKGKTAMQAAIDGTRSVASSLLASTLTSICVFFPILFTEGLTKMIFSDLSWSVIFSLTISLIVALTVIPTLYNLVCADKKMLEGGAFKDEKASLNTTKEQSKELNKKPIKQAKTRKSVMQKALNAYDVFLRKCLRKRWLVLLVTALIFFGSVSLIFTTGTNFLPSVDQRTVEVIITFDAADELNYCQEKTYEIYESIKNKIPNALHISADVSTDNLLATSLKGTIRLVLKDNDGDTTQSALNKVIEITEGYDDLNKISVTEVDGVLASLMSGLGGIADVSVSIQSNELSTLKEVYEKVEKKAKTEYPFFTKITNDLTEEVLEYKIKIDGKKCIDYGIDYQVAVATLRAGIAGYDACSAEIDGQKYTVIVKFKDNALTDYYGGIENFTLGVSNGNTVKLKDVAEITETYSPSVITKNNGKYVMTVSAESTGIDSGTASAAFNIVLNEVLKDYDGCSAAENGVNKYLDEVFDGLTVSIIVAFILLFAVMACQFESLLKPFIVIFSIPLSFSGAFIALAISGLTLNVVSFIGLIMLMGVVVNNAIVMIDRIEQLRKESELSPYEALIEGSKSRMRAVWMTTLTTVLALVPLSLAIGKGSELMQPLAVVVMGGLTLAMLATLIIIPVVYSIFKRIPCKNAEGYSTEMISGSLKVANLTSNNSSTDGETFKFNDNITLTMPTKKEEPVTLSNNDLDKSVDDNKNDKQSQNDCSLQSNDYGIKAKQNFIEKNEPCLYEYNNGMGLTEKKLKK